MSIHLTEGAALPEFYYDTPFVPQKSFYQLAAAGEPLFLVFLANFGHPVTRTYLARYCETAKQLKGCRLAVVVRSLPQSISRALSPEAIPFELICDAEGALYEYFEVQQETSPLKYNSLDAVRILRKAKQQGFQLPKGQPQQLPLTLLVNAEAKVLLAYYGRTLTDFPEDGTALEKTAELICRDISQPEPPEEDADLQIPISQPLPGALPEKQELPGLETLEPPAQSQWVDNTQEILLDFHGMEKLDKPEEVISPDQRYNTTGEIDIVGLMAQIDRATPKRHNRLEDTLSGFEEIKL